MDDARWEHGSDFHWPGLDIAGTDDDASRWLAGLEAIRYAAGRGALRALLDHGGWPRVWLPSYVCAELVAAVGDRVRFYADDPSQAQGRIPADAQSGHAIVRINYFGLRRPNSAATLRERGLTVIDDHTHDPCGPWARDSDADYCLASLRKSLPLPDGAVLWSPVGGRLPSKPEACEAAAAKLPAMLLKSLYLAGHPVSKPRFRALAIAAEDRLAELAGVGMSAVSAELLECLPIAQLRARRRENFQAFASHLAAEEVGLLQPADPSLTPFACVLLFPSAVARELARRRLIAARIYPAVLWPLDELPDHRAMFPEACEVADRVLALHCDARYSAADMQRVAAGY
ncbi:hypothetical protein DB30_00166 [Enhygromyxa salina]|uniref:DegT/DnrJ/EryC1/StrS aminotransferase family protein n=1 Tax=Enhygromyxa salina TaxID=215803 RepID=A0A0C2DJ08_9BACT|nr:hypothetical protein DB30_00166 [Enhygromyxa salina]